MAAPAIPIIPYEIQTQGLHLALSLSQLSPPSPPPFPHLLAIPFLLPQQAATSVKPKEHHHPPQQPRPQCTRSRQCTFALALLTTFMLPAATKGWGLQVRTVKREAQQWSPSLGEVNL